MTDFVIHAYRESLLVGKKSKFWHDLQLLSDQHGQEVCLIKQANKMVEAVFSKEPGYLLGESVWQYLGKPEYLIYAEAIANSAQLFLVVVKNNHVYLDTKIVSSLLKEELTPFMLGEVPYRIVIYGDLPLRDTETFGEATFKFPKKLIKSFETLKEPMLLQLPKYEIYHLQPLPIAISTSRLKGKKPGWAVVILLFTVFLISFALLENRTPHKIAKTPNPYQVVLQSPDPSQPILILSQRLLQLYLLPGWESIELHWQGGNTYQIMMHPKESDWVILQAWALSHHYQLNLNADGVLLTGSLNINERSPLPAVISTQLVLNFLYAHLNQGSFRPSITLGTTQSEYHLQEVPITLEVTDISPNILGDFSVLLTGLPIVLKTIDLKMDNGLISGRILLSIWGN